VVEASSGSTALSEAYFARLIGAVHRGDGSGNQPGGLVGGAAATALVHITRLGRTFVAGLLLWGCRWCGSPSPPARPWPSIALVVVGVGNAIEDVAGFTLVARCAGPHSAGRVLGATEFVFQAGLGIGAVAAPLLLHTLGVRGTLGLLGGGLTVLTLAHVRRFARLDLRAFLVAIASNSMSGAAADALVDQRLLENTLADADGGSAE